MIDLIYFFLFSVFLSTGLKYNMEFLLFCKYVKLLFLAHVSHSHSWIEPRGQGHSLHGLNLEVKVMVFEFSYKSGNISF